MPPNKMRDTVINQTWTKLMKYKEETMNTRIPSGYCEDFAKNATYAVFLGSIIHPVYYGRIEDIPLDAPVANLADFWFSELETPRVFKKDFTRILDCIQDWMKGDRSTAFEWDERKYPSREEWGKMQTQKLRLKRQEEERKQQEARQEEERKRREQERTRQEEERKQQKGHWEEEGKRQEQEWKRREQEWKPKAEEWKRQEQERTRREQERTRQKQQRAEQRAEQKAEQDRKEMENEELYNNKKNLTQNKASFYEIATAHGFPCDKPEQIRPMYKKLLVKLHPDRNVKASVEEKQKMTDLSAKITSLYHAIMSVCPKYDV